MYFVFILLCCATFYSQAFHLPRESLKCDNQECKDYADQIVKNLNKSAEPCENFYEYACGGWKSAHKAGPGQMVSIFSEQMDDINKNIKSLLEKEVDEKESSVQKAQTMYQHCLQFSGDQIPKEVNQITLDLGGWPIVDGPAWSAYNFYDNFDDLLPVLAEFRLKKPAGVMFAIAVSPNIEDSTSPRLHILPPDISQLPIPPNLTPADRLQIQQQLVAIAKMFNPSLDEMQAQTDAITMLQLNDYLSEMLHEAGFSQTKQQPSEFDMTVEELSQHTKMDWVSFLGPLLQGISYISPMSKVEVGIGLPYLIRLADFAQSPFFSARAVVNYEILNIVTGLMGVGSVLARGGKSISLEPLMVTKDELMPTVTDKSDASKAAICPQLVSECFAYAVAWKYARLHHDVEKETKVAKDMTENIFHIFGDRLKKQDWIDKPSLEQAELKIAKMKGFYVYPNWTDHLEKVNEYYGSLKDSEGFLEDFLNCQEMNVKEDLKDYAKVPHLQKWPMAPLITNAFYYVLDNSMTILEGIMQKPIFSPNRLKTMNYGSLGSIIGHEITHGFDQNGVQFDGNGRLNPWMSEKSRKQFETKAECFKDQYSQYRLTKEDLPGTNGVNVDGPKTANENIADNGGLQQAYWAFQKILEKDKEELPESLKDFTHEQVFFLSYAQMWCTVYGENPRWQDQLDKDVHCPAKFRIIGTLSNFDEFGKQFSCSEKDPMVRKDACHIW